MKMVYAAGQSRLGWVLAAGDQAGVRFIGLCDQTDALFEDIIKRYPGVELTEDKEFMKPVINKLLIYLAGEGKDLDIQTNLTGTPFQKRVWLALKQVPYGVVITYSHLAENMGLGASSVRAVAHGCATNPVSLVVPCHRIIRKEGGLGGYYWGLDRKRALLEMEGAFHKEARQIGLF